MSGSRLNKYKLVIEPDEEELRSVVENMSSMKEKLEKSAYVLACIKKDFLGPEVNVSLHGPSNSNFKFYK